jgi:hypothetical protein
MCPDAELPHVLSAMISMKSAGYLLFTRSSKLPSRHSRESGNPFALNARARMDSRFRGNDGIVAFVRAVEKREETSVPDTFIGPLAYLPPQRG